MSYRQHAGHELSCQCNVRDLFYVNRSTRRNNHNRLVFNKKRTLIYYPFVASSSDPANTKRYNNAIGTSATFHRRSQNVLVTLCVSLWQNRNRISPVFLGRQTSCLGAVKGYTASLEGQHLAACVIERAVVRPPTNLVLIGADRNHV